MRVWRLVRAERAADALSGKGASLYPGRWNRLGQPAVYAASSLALAVLEVFVHLEVPQVEVPYLALELHVPDDQIEDLAEDLPPNWTENLEWSREIGGRWIENGQKPALRVPSAVVPYEPILVLNPKHPTFSRIRVLRKVPFYWDRRLFKAL